MTQKAKNIALLGIAFFGLLMLSELSLRFYGTELRMFLSDLGRKAKISADRNEFLTAARNAGVSEKTFNIYFLGESTMWGVPYGPYMSIPNIVGYQLGENLGGRALRIINFSSAAKDVAYTNFLAQLLLQEKEVFHPSLIVIYSGHNEFLKFHPSEPDLEFPGAAWLAEHSELARQLLILIARSRGKLLEIDRRTFFDRGIFPFDRQGYDKVLANYEHRLTDLVESAEKESLPIIFSTLVSNYATWEPNRSVFCSSQSGRDRKRFLDVFEQGRNAEGRGDYANALTAYNQALYICDQFAEVHFRLGKIYQALGENEKAWESFQKAIDYDGMPVPALSKQNDIIRAMDRFGQIYVVDSLARFRSHLPDGLVDDRLIIDGIHPNADGYLLISDAIANKIHDLFASVDEVIKPLDMETAKKVFGLDQTKMFEVDYETGRWITRLATWRYDPARRLEMAERFFHEAINIEPQRPEGFLGLGIVYLLKRETHEAGGFLNQARAMDPKIVDEYLSVSWIRKIARRAASKTTAPAQVTP